MILTTTKGAGDFLCYVFGLISYSDMLKKYKKEEVVRNGWDGRLLLDAKSYVFNLACGNKVNTHDYDLNVLQRSALRRGYRQRPDLQAKLKRLSKTCDPILPKEMNRILARTLMSSDYTTYVSKFAAKKLAFLVTSYGMEHKDLLSEMRMFSYYAVMRKYPEFNDAMHIMNICKRAAHNRGINIIHENTAGNRNKLLTQLDSDGEKVYSAVHIPIDLLANEGVYMESGIDGAVFPHDNLVVFPKEKEVDVSRALEELEDRQPPRKRLFLKLMRGHPDPAFSTFLGEPNDDFAYREPSETILKRVCAFMGVEMMDARLFLEGLSEYLE